MKGQTAARRYRVYGIVQGVGFRPFVSRLANRLGLRGSVCNKGPYVEILARAEEAMLDKFSAALLAEAPERSSILKVDCEDAPELPAYPDFSIITSAKESGEIFVSPDIATCDKCKQELFDPNNRRYLHPFINCTACGPRLTILDSMPYDRERTSMGEFPMCPTCEWEYTHPETRRYDAQPVCCNDCGPEVYLIGRPERGADAITAVRRLLADGGIAAVKGIGGFHLCCDATSEEAVGRLRALKARPAKPFAVMLKNLDAARRECAVDAAQEKILDGHQKPILLLDKRPCGRLCEAVAPGNPKVGVMLPYAPVQMLLFDNPDGVAMPDCLVMTSGNPSGAPICRTDEDAVAALSGLCDLILSHNRIIRTRADDTVLDFFRGRPYMVRRSRGYAPLPFLLSAPLSGTVLAVGGELKNTFCVGKNNLFYPSAYIGDMTDLRTVDALRETVPRFERLLEAEPQAVACDLHPRYNTTEYAGELGLPLIPIQHHWAHVVSCMAENDFSEKVIGVSFDGTGYGTDGTVWGGEFLLSDCQSFTRLGSIRPFFQRGGDVSSREGWRIAVSMLLSVCGGEAADIARRLALCDEKNFRAQQFLADQNVNSVLSTSAGRLFDAVSAIAGIRRASSFEGEASMALEFAAEAWEKEHGPAGGPDYAVERDGELFRLPTERLFAALTDAALAGAPPGCLALRFHESLAQMIEAGCRAAAEQTGVRAAALTGGVFQNRLLLRLCCDRLEAAGFRVLLHSLVPPNDGGIALGQAVAAMYRLQSQGR